MFRLRRRLPAVKPLPPHAFGAIMTVQWRMMRVEPVSSSTMRV